MTPAAEITLGFTLALSGFTALGCVITDHLRSHAKEYRDFKRHKPVYDALKAAKTNEQDLRVKLALEKRRAPVQRHLVKFAAGQTVSEIVAKEQERLARKRRAQKEARA